jgi:hypothetical protein
MEKHPGIICQRIFSGGAWWAIMMVTYILELDTEMANWQILGTRGK